MTTTPKHPIQPVGFDTRGVIRFKRNAIVDMLLEECTARGGTDMHKMAVLAAQGKISQEDRIQFAQLIGYSVSGFCDLSYIPDRLITTVTGREAKAIANRIKL